MIEVVEYRRGWRGRFVVLRAAYAAALDSAGVPHRIEHVGSTSVPGLAAKPVVDVDVVVAEHDVTAAVAALGTIGFVSRASSTRGITGRGAAG